MNKDYLIFIILIISIILSANLAILLNLPYFRQILPYVLLTIIPGLLMLQILKLNHLKSLEKIVLSIGLSIIIVTFAGMVINFIPSTRPLNLFNILVFIDVLLIILILVGYLINKVPPLSISLKFSKYNSYEKVILIISILLPTLSLLGTYSVKTFNNYTFLYLLVFLIPFLVIFISIVNGKIKSNYIYPISIFTISLSLILAYTLISNYIYGTDNNLEYYLFNVVLNTEKWQVFNTLQRIMPVETSISITVLPAIYQILLKFPNPTLLFKLIFVLPLSLTPLVVYRISKNYNNELYSFLTAIFIIASISFFSQTEAYRTYVAVFFFALAIMVLISSNINEIVRKFLFIIFIIGIIISHYSSAYVFFFILLLSILILQSLKLIIKFNYKNSDIPKKTNINSLFQRKDFLSIGLLLLISTIIFFYYSQITSAPFDNGINFLVNTLGQFNNFFLSESRDPTVYQALGSTLSNAPLIRYINFFTSWTSIIFIALGLLTALVSIIDIKILTRKFKLNLHYTINVDFFGLSISSLIILAAAVILPFILVFYSLPRLYYFLIIILSIFFIIGAKVIAENLKIKKSYFIILIILIPILLSNIGITPQFFGEPNSILLNPSNNINNTYYIHDSEAASASWLKNYRNLNTTIYTDSGSSGTLISVALVPREDLGVITRYGYNGYTYLSYYNLKTSKLIFWQYATVWKINSINEYSDINNQNLIYDNGNSEVLR